MVYFIHEIRVGGELEFEALIDSSRIFPDEVSIQAPAIRLTDESKMINQTFHLPPRWMLHPQPIGLDGEEIETGCELKGLPLRRTYG